MNSRTPGGTHAAVGSGGGDDAGDHCALRGARPPLRARTQGLAYGYIHGIPGAELGGMLVERNDWEMYAGLASGMMADIRLVLVDVRHFYDGMSCRWLMTCPRPAAVAPHG